MSFPHILLIDDDEDDQDIFLTAMSEVSDSVVCNTESNAQQALQKLSDKALNPDLIFLDLNMPIMDGRQFLQALKNRESLKDIRVIILSTSSHFSTINELLALGAERFITKPNNYQDLKSILQSIFE